MMDDMYGLHNHHHHHHHNPRHQNNNHVTAAAAAEEETMMSPENLMLLPEYHHHAAVMMNSSAVRFGSDELISATLSDSSATAVTAAAAAVDDESSAVVKARIAAHPHYPRLLRAYIDCHKVGAPPEIARILEDIGRESDMYRQEVGMMRTCVGGDPELDEFMETYCEILNKYKSDLSKPFDEATSFLSDIESQLRDLCKGAFVRSSSAEEAAVSSDEECSGGEVDVHDIQPKEEERDLKDQLLRKFGSHISSLKLEFSKKKKKGKLPREARQMLFEWWNAHYKWPYPTEGDKIALADITGLDQRQINNWFINQRKRHWKPSENMQFALMDNISGQYFTDN
ncbi:hypothetical protein vseg_002172 [Gypsophila vaccaria]